LEGEDLILESLLRDVVEGTYIDAGANHPITINNTYGFYRRGWSGLAIDGNSSFAGLWADLRPNDTFVHGLLSDTVKEVHFQIFPDHTMSSMDPETSERYAARVEPGSVKIEMMKTSRLGDLRKTCLPGGEIHLLSVDVEGEDLNVLIGADLQVMRAGVIVVETKNCSLYRPLENSLVQYLTALGYRLIAKTPLDAFFVLPEKSYLSWIPQSLL
jgi:Methyltransferase FkbM domain